MYIYKADIVRVIDGDTVVADIDCGFTIHVEKTLRLSGINAPEMRGDDKVPGQLAKRHLTDLLENLKPITVRTMKDAKEKYGRYLAVLYAGYDTFNQLDINQQMITDGHAVEYMS